MGRIEREELEQPTSLDRAELIVDKFLNDPTLYPDDDFRLRRGVCKVLAEEYMPLVLVAQVVPGVEAVRLFPGSKEGPDGEIRFNNQLGWRVQITCAHEDHQRALMREQLQQDGLALGGKRRRDGDGTVICESSLFVPDEEADARVVRILCAVQAKELKYHKDTDTLIVLEAPAGRYLQQTNLHRQVMQALQERQSNYERTYVVYGEKVKLARPIWEANLSCRSSLWAIAEECRLPMPA